MTPGRLPYTPLERILRARYDSADQLPGLAPRRGDPDLWRVEAAALMLGVSTRQILRYKAAGLTPKQADAAATAAGLHPLEVWGHTWTVAEIAAGIYRWQAARERRQKTPPATEAAA